MAMSTNMRMMAKVMRSMILNGPRVCAPRVSGTPCTQFLGPNNNRFAQITPMTTQIRQLGGSASNHQQQDQDKPISFAQALEREIQEEAAELSQRLASDQFPGFSVETEDSDVKLTKQVGDSTVVVRFSVSSSLSEWRSDDDNQQQQQQQQSRPSNSEEQQNSFAYTLLSLPDFQVQITRNGRTFETSCYFEELEHDEETGEPYSMDPVFHVDEVVIYEGEPKENEFAVSTEYFRDELQEGLFQYLADHGIDEEFSKNLVSFATNYEKKQYIGLMKRLKDFVSK